jgi:hypothetical protein
MPNQGDAIHFSLLEHVDPLGALLTGGRSGRPSQGATDLPGNGLLSAARIAAFVCFGRKKL